MVKAIGLFFIFFAAPTWAQGPSVLPATPDYLYHWISSEILQHIAQYEEGDKPVRVSMQTPSGVAPFFKNLEVIGGVDRYGNRIKDNVDSLIVSIFPELKGKLGVFTTTNPATGSIGSAHTERYGDVLVRFKLNKARIKRANLQVSSAFSKVTDKLTNEQKNANLIFHDSGIKEWIILDPSVIESFTADPEVLRPELEAALKKLKLPKTHRDFAFAEDDFHAINFNDQPTNSEGFFKTVSSNARNYAIYAITKFLKFGRVLVPQKFAGAVKNDVQWPNADQQQEGRSRLYLAEQQLVLKERMIEAKFQISADSALNRSLFKILTSSLSFYLKEKMTTAATNSIQNYDRATDLVIALDVAVLSPVLNAATYNNRFRGRYFEWGLNPANRVEPYEKFTNDEIKDLNLLLIAAADPRITLDQLVEKIVSLFKVEEVVAQRLTEVFGKFGIRPFISAYPNVNSCINLF